MKELRDRVAVVTGAASGIGLALAERLAAEGMKVVLADVEAAALAAARERLAAAGAATLAVRTDVSDFAQVAALADRTLAAFGAVHVLCNNAGVAGDAVPVWEQPIETWRWVLDVNLWGVIHGIRTFVPIMLGQDTEGHVVNTASMAGHLSLPFLSPYHASKFAVVTISESLHYELELGRAKVRTSVLCPGFVRTAIMDSDRNRPAVARTAARPVSEAEQNVDAAFRDAVAAGIDPAEAAARVVEAIRAERFWVFPHPDLLRGVRHRLETIVAGRNPGLETLPEELRSRMRL